MLKSNWRWDSACAERASAAFNLPGNRCADGSGKGVGEEEGGKGAGVTAL
jgi:hypothetical protein